MPSKCVKQWSCTSTSNKKGNLPANHHIHPPQMFIQKLHVRTYPLVHITPGTELKEGGYRQYKSGPDFQKHESQCPILVQQKDWTLIHWYPQRHNHHQLKQKANKHRDHNSLQHTVHYHCYAMCILLHSNLIMKVGFWESTKILQTIVLGPMCTSRYSTFAY
jgi:hypothetical protein